MNSQARHVVLIGLPGVGKSSIGRGVAEGLRRPFVDMDVELEQRLAAPIPVIFSTRGEGFFRAAERELSMDLARSPCPTVIASGGGWVTDENTVAHLRGVSRIIYLRVVPEEALRRMGRGVLRRPLLASGDPEAAMTQLYGARRQLYERYAEMTVETTGVQRADVIARVQELVRAAECDFEREND